MHKVKFIDLGKQYLNLRDEIISKFDEISIAGAYILSEEVADFERRFAEYCNVRYAIGVGNGSDALYLSLLSLGIGPGDEVITAPNSFIASAWVIARTGARIVFADVEDDMNISPEKIKKVITKRTKALLPVHLTGRIADMDSLQEIAQKNGLFIVEDAAQAVGAKYRDKRSGSFGICAGFSLHPLKNLHVHGDGGIITTNDDKIYEKLLKFRNHGLKNRDACEFWGINSRLDAIQAAIANIKLKYIDTWNERYRNIADIYTKNLSCYVTTPMLNDHEKPVFQRYMIRCPNRDRLQQHLNNKGVETKVNYPIPIHLQEAAKELGYKKGDFPKAEELANTILSLPIYPELSDEEVYYVVENIIEFQRKEL
jgi:dTDP-4-amino-4,6-dideoxygalactose transaminase